MNFVKAILLLAIVVGAPAFLIGMHASQIARLETRIADLEQSKADSDAAAAATISEIKEQGNAAVDSLTKRVTEMANPVDHSLLTPDQQHAKFAADYPAIAEQLEHPTIFDQINDKLDGLTNRVTALENKPSCCAMPEVSKADFEQLTKKVDAIHDRAATPVKTATPRATGQAIAPDFPGQVIIHDPLLPSHSSKSAVDATVARPQWQAAIDRHNAQYVTFICTENKCLKPGFPCSNFSANVLDSDKFADGMKDRESAWCTLNMDEDSDAKSHFSPPATPYIVVWDKSQGKWYGIQADGNDSPAQALWRVDQCIAALAKPDDQTPKAGRHRLIN